MNLSEFKADGYLPSIPKQGPLLRPRRMFASYGIESKSDNVYILQLTKGNRTERFVYAADDTETHKIATEWCDSFINFTKWSAKVYCRATRLGDDNLYVAPADAPRRGGVVANGIASYLEAKYGWKVVVDDRCPDEFVVSLEWKGNGHSDGEKLLEILRLELYANSVTEKVGFQIIRIHWQDPRTIGEQHETMYLLGQGNTTKNAVFSAIKNDKRLCDLCSEVNLYYSQTSLRAKVIFGHALLEEFFKAETSRDKLFLFSHKRRKELESLLFRNLVSDIPNEELPSKFKSKIEKLRGAISRWLNTPANSPDEVLAFKISKLINMEVCKVASEIEKLRKVRGTFSHDTSPEMRDSYREALHFVDGVISAYLSDQLKLPLQKVCGLCVTPFQMRIGDTLS
jgi:hypothetical protein